MHFRRPAQLDWDEAVEIPNPGDPELRDDLAHATARAVVLGERARVDADVVARVAKLVDDDGLDEMAELWADAPATTLPGVLWRLLPLRALADGNGTDFAFDLDDLFAGQFTGDLAELCEQGAALLGDGAPETAEELRHAAHLWRRGQLA